MAASKKTHVGRIRGSQIIIPRPHAQEVESHQIFWRKIWTSFLLLSCSFCSSEGEAIGDIGGGDNDYIRRASTPRAIIMASESNKMNIFTIIGIVVVVILVAGYFGVHGVNF